MSDLELRPPDSAQVAREQAFLIADVRGYTRFTRERGDAEAARLAQRFAEVARDAVEARSGRVLELRGDEVLAVFSSSAQAVRSAVELQLACAEEVASDPSLPLHVGVGIDAGEAVPVEGGFRGAALNTAARLCSQAAAGQVLVTAGLAARAGAIEAIGFARRGTAELKGFDSQVELIEVVAEERPRPHPRAGSERVPLELEPDTELVSRERELSWLRGSWRQARRGNGRLCFLSGPAQSGKSRLSCEIAAFAASEGATVSYAGAGGAAAAEALAALREALDDPSPTLLVLDDLEATGEALAPTLAKLLDSIESCPTLVLGLLRNPDASRSLAELIARADERGDGHRSLGPLDAEGVREIARLYTGDDVEQAPLEAIARASERLPGRIHERMSEWAEQEATRRLAAAAEFLATERRERRADLAFANNVIGLKLARLYGAEGEAEAEAGVCPYKGLASFAEKDARLFFGRERLVGELAARTVSSGLLAVVGASGSGKSSLIAAGLLPSLKAGLLPGSERWRALIIRPGEHPCVELEALPTSSQDDGERLVLVVDQFEEVFTTCQDEEERGRFVERLVAVAGDPERAVVVLALRADFSGECAAYPEFARLLAANLVLVGPMSQDELRRAIELPARRTGLRIESALTETLVGELGDEAGGLPLLSTALVELWLARHDGWLRLEAHERLGGVRGAVARLAEASFAQLEGDEREIARAILLRLVAEGEGEAAVRRRVPVAEIDPTPAARAVLKRFTQDRLITASDGVVEVAHEALIREWPRLRSWLEEDAQGRQIRAHVTQAARQWEERGRDQAELYRGARLSATLDWAGRHGRELNQLEHEFLLASREASDREAERQRRANRRLKGLLAGVGVLFVLALVAGGVALVSRSNAKHEAKVALGRQLGAEAVSEPRIDLSMLLARESLNLDRSPQTEGTLLATLLRAPAVTGTFTVPIEDRPQAVKVSPDDRTIAVGTNTDVMRLYDTRTHQQVGTLPIANADYAYVPTSGDLFGAQPGPHPFNRLIDPRTGRVLQRFELSKLWQTTFSTPVEPLAVTPDGRYAFLLWAVVNPDGSSGASYAERWTLARSGPSRLVPLHGHGIVAATATQGDRLVVAEDGRISTWNAPTMKMIRSVPGPTFGSQFVNGTISPDGRTFGYGLDDGTVHFFDIATGKATVGAAAHSAAVQRIAFSPDSRVAVSIGDDGLGILWNLSTGQPIERLGGHAIARVLGADFSTDGKTLYTASLDGTILQYDLSGSRSFGSPFSLGSPGLPAPPHSPPLPLRPLLAMSPDARLFAASVMGDGTTQSSVQFYSVSSLRRVGTISLRASRMVGAGAWAGKRFVLGADRGLVRQWDVSARTRQRGPVLHGLSPKGQVRDIATADRGRLVAAVDGYYGPQPTSGGPPPEEGQLAIWRDGKLVGGKPMNLRTFGNAVALSPDGSMAAVATDDNTVPIVDTRTGRLERTIKPQTGAITLAFSSNGILATGAWTGILNLWNPKTGLGIGHSTLTAPAPVGAIAFSPSGKLFATAGGSSGHTKVWVTATEQQFGADFPGGEGTWGNMAYTPDGRYLIAIFSDGSAFRWPATVTAWEDHACAVAGRNFTREEWRRFVGGRNYARTCSGLPVLP